MHRKRGIKYIRWKVKKGNGKKVDGTGNREGRSTKSEWNLHLILIPDFVFKKFFWKNLFIEKTVIQKCKILG